MAKRLISSMALAAALGTSPLAAADPPVAEVVLGIHGGANTAKRDMPPELEKALIADLERALAEGYARLQEEGGTSLDAVESAIRVLEDSPHFNAGKGAVFTHSGRNEMDASIMEGEHHRAGAVASVTTIKNPISAARAVMEKSKHVLLVSQGAEKFAQESGLDIVDPKYFWTLKRWQELQNRLKDHPASAAGDKQSAHDDDAGTYRWGTVGAVALDRDGHLAAGTSTGGRTDKLFGRVGDSPILGAGNYADNATCAVSGTGHGEYFMRFLAAYDIAALMKYRGLTVDAAATEVVMRTLKPAGGEGGVIALDAQGNFAMAYNTPTMYRGYITRDGRKKVMLWSE